MWHPDRTTSPRVPDPPSVTGTQGSKMFPNSSKRQYQNNWGGYKAKFNFIYMYTLHKELREMMGKTSVLESDTHSLNPDSITKWLH